MSILRVRFRADESIESQFFVVSCVVSVPKNEGY